MRQKAAQMFVLARDFGRAAALHEASADWAAAARLYEEAGDFAKAAGCHLEAGEHRRAAECLDSVGEHLKAAGLYEKLGERESQADCLVRAGRHAAAAALFRALGNGRAEMDALSRVGDHDPAKGPSVRRLAALLIQRNRISEATQLCIGALRDSVPAKGDLELHRMLFSLFERQGLKNEAQRIQLRMERLSRRVGDTLPDGIAPVSAAVAPPQKTMQFQAHAAVQDALATIPGVQLGSLQGKVPPSLPSDPAAELAAQPRESYTYLKAIPLFSRLKLEDMTALHRLGLEVEFQPDQIVVEAGVPAPGLFVLIEGTADVLSLGEAGGRHLNSLGPGDHLGEISMLCNSLTSARVVASTWVRALQIPQAQFERFLVTHPGAALRIYRLFAEGLAGRVRVLSLGSAVSAPSASAASSGPSGSAKRYPCAYPHPSRSSVSACARVSTPSATTSRPRFLPKSTSVSTMRRFFSSVTCRTNEASTFSTSIGMRCR
jgi:tetratricopeptide (TPR) repeat protein